MKRIVMSAVWAAAMATAGLVSAAHAQLIDRPIPGDPVKLDSGNLAGKLLPSGVKAYFGIPFVAPPLYENRWRDPQPAKSWQGTYYAGRMAPMCQQTQRAHNINHFFGDEAVSEDCLYMNIWAPGNAKAGDKLPVVVFIYGGGLTVGSSGMANYGGENVAKKGAIFVNFNYRVGALGFMAHPELTRESGHNSSGNYGFLDQIAALKWIQRNIAQFGGDPTHVTISGQSGGSRSVSVLTSSPLARGLFSGAIGMSGSIVPDFGQGDLPSLKEVEASGVALLEKLNVKTIAEARNLAPDTIAAAQGEVSPTGAEIDGYVLPERGSAIYAKGQQNDVPMIMGFMRDESRSQLNQANSVAELRQLVTAGYGQRASQILAAYPVRSDADAATVGALMARESGMEAGMRAWAVAQAKTGKSPAYLYMFSRVHPYAPGITFADHDPTTAGAYHTGDVPYWFDTLDAYNIFRTTRNWTAYDRDLTDKMTTMLINFTKTGVPSAPSAPAWPRMVVGNEKALEFGNNAISVMSLDSKRLDLMASAGPLPRAGRGGARD